MQYYRVTWMFLDWDRGTDKDACLVLPQPYHEETSPKGCFVRQRGNIKSRHIVLKTLVHTQAEVISID